MSEVFLKYWSAKQILALLSTMIIENGKKEKKKEENAEMEKKRQNEIKRKRWEKKTKWRKKKEKWKKKKNQKKRNGKEEKENSIYIYIYIFKISDYVDRGQLVRAVNTPTVSLQRGKTPPKQVLWIWQ